MKKPKAGLFILLSVLMILGGCKHSELNFFEKNTAIPNYKWDYQFKATGRFEIKDSISPYNIYIVLRHTDAYKYNNIWLNIGLQSPGDSMYFQKVELSLGSDAGGWEGTGLNDIWETRKLLVKRPRKFIKAGIYHYSIAQIMRDNPLEHIMSAGIRLQKTVQ